ncbi:unnamed protein product [Lampetra fluviatilis]
MSARSSDAEVERSVLEEMDENGIIRMAQFPDEFEYQNRVLDRGDDGIEEFYTPGDELPDGDPSKHGYDGDFYTDEPSLTASDIPDSANSWGPPAQNERWASRRRRSNTTGGHGGSRKPSLQEFVEAEDALGGAHGSAEEQPDLPYDRSLMNDSLAQWQEMEHLLEVYNKTLDASEDFSDGPHNAGAAEFLGSGHESHFENSEETYGNTGNLLGDTMHFPRDSDVQGVYNLEDAREAVGAGQLDSGAELRWAGAPRERMDLNRHRLSEEFQRDEIHPSSFIAAEIMPDLNGESADERNSRVSEPSQRSDHSSRLRNVNKQQDRWLEGDADYSPQNRHDVGKTPAGLMSTQHKGTYVQRSPLKADHGLNVIYNAQDDHQHVARSPSSNATLAAPQMVTETPGRSRRSKPSPMEPRGHVKTPNRSQSSRASASRSGHTKTASNDRIGSRSPSPIGTAHNARASRSISPGRSQRQLNYPLPDLSKVGPKVNFPRQGHVYQNKRASLGEVETPKSARSPADVVRRVLADSDAAPLCEGQSSRVVTSDPATDLVHQLQEDYDRLLTKYAEAENTIDQLRLGAKVSLYSDSPVPRQVVQQRVLPHSSQVMTLQFPHSQQAMLHNTNPATSEWAHSTAQFAPYTQPGEHEVVNEHGAQGSTGSFGRAPQPPLDSLDPSITSQLETELAKQVKKFKEQVDIFQRMQKAGQVTQQEQFQTYQRLREGQDVLERGYMAAKQQHQMAQRNSAGSGEFDANRVLESAIFQLGMQLEEISECMNETPRTPLQFGDDDTLLLPIAPSALAPSPTSQTPYPHSPLPDATQHRGALSMELSSLNGDSDSPGALLLGLPPPLTSKRERAEIEYARLLGQYNNFKTLPDAFSSRAMDAGSGDGASERSDSASPDGGRTPRPRTPMWPARASPSATEHDGKAGGDAALRSGRRTAQHSGAAAVAAAAAAEHHATAKAEPRAPVTPRARGAQPRAATSRSSLSSGTGDAANREPRPRPARRPAAGTKQEDRIVSPETDSGFVGSESGRLGATLTTPETTMHVTRHPSGVEAAPKQRRAGAAPRAAPRVPQDEEARATGAGSKRWAAGEQTSSTRGDVTPIRATAPRLYVRGAGRDGEKGEISTPRALAVEAVRTAARATRRSADEGPGSPGSTRLGSGQPSRGRRLSQLSDGQSSRSSKQEAMLALQSEIAKLGRRLEQSKRPGHVARDPERSRETSASSSGRSRGRTRRRSLVPPPAPLASTPKRDKSVEDLHREVVKLREEVRSRFSQSQPPPLRSQHAHCSDTEGSHAASASRAAIPNRAPRMHRSQSEGRLSLRGPYTGRDYISPTVDLASVGVPADSRDTDQAVPCHFCNGSGVQEVVRAGSLDGLNLRVPLPSPRQRRLSDTRAAPHCPLCRGQGTVVVSRGHQEGRAKHDSFQRQGRSKGKRRSHEAATLEAAAPILQPGVSFPYSLQYVPHTPPIIYYASPAPMYVPVSPARLYAAVDRVPGQPPERTRRSHSVGPARDGDGRWVTARDILWKSYDPGLFASLDRAMEAAECVRRRTKKLSRALRSDVTHAGDFYNALV